MGYPSDAKVLEAAQSELWTVYSFAAPEARAVVSHADTGYVISANTTQLPARVYMYVLGGGTTRTNVEITSFTEVNSESIATDYRAEARYVES